MIANIIKYIEILPEVWCVKVVLDVAAGSNFIMVVFVPGFHFMICYLHCFTIA
jgi:hypothetical protein